MSGEVLSMFGLSDQAIQVLAVAAGPVVLAFMALIGSWRTSAAAARQVIETRNALALQRQEENAQRIADRDHDEKRQDELSARAEAAANRIVAANVHTAEVVTQSSAEVLELGQKTHDLVNSAMTTQKELTLTFAKAALAAMQHSAIAEASPSAESIAEIAALEKKVKELEAELVERARQQKALDTKDAASKLAAANAKPTVVEFASPQEVSVVEKDE